MYQGIRPLVTTGVALVGASVIAVSPLTVPPSATTIRAPLPAAQPVVEMSDVQLAGLVQELTNFVNAVVNVPGSTVENYETALETLQGYLDNAGTPRQVIGALGLGFGRLYDAPIDAVLDPLVVNVPQNEGDWDFVDAALLTIRDLADDPLSIATIPATFLFAYGLGYSPAQAATITAATYLLKPLSLSRPLLIALANSLPSPFGGDVNSLDPADQGWIYRYFMQTTVAVQTFIQELVGQPEQMVAKQGGTGLAKEVVPVDTWPPNADTVVRTVRDVGAELREVPGEILGEVAENVRVVSQYLKQGRPLDAVRYLAAHSLDLPMRWAEIPLELSSTILPPRVDRIVGHVVGRTVGVAHDIAGEIEPDPLTTPGIQHKQITPSGINAPQGNPGNFVKLSLPNTQKVDDITNVVLNNGTDPVTGNQVTKTDSNRPKVGSNVRAAVKEVRKEIRSTIKEVRQGVRDVVKAVTGLGKKKEVKAESKESPPPKAGE